VLGAIIGGLAGVRQKAPRSVRESAAGSGTCRSSPDPRPAGENPIRNPPRLHPARFLERNLFPKEIFLLDPGREFAATIQFRTGRVAIPTNKRRPTTPTIIPAFNRLPCFSQPRGPNLGAFFECGSKLPLLPTNPATQFSNALTLGFFFALFSLYFFSLFSHPHIPMTPILSPLISSIPPPPRPR